jgi:nucleoside-diphosphate-sugar epimerase
LVQEPGLEHTAFRHGVFMNYFSFGATGCKEQVLKVFPFAVNVAERMATIPGTGDEKITFTTVADVGRFVAAAVELENWEPESCMVGEMASYKEIVQMAEGVTGEEFTVTYLGREGLERTVKEKTEAGDVRGRFFPEVMMAIMDGLGEVPATLNKVTDVKPVGIKEFLEKWWGAKE